MRGLVGAISIVACACFVGGCGSSSPPPDEAKLHEMLGKPPSRPKSQGVGQKRLDAGGSTAAPATPTS